MEWKWLAIGALAGVVLGYLRTSKGGGRTPATPSGF